MELWCNFLLFYPMHGKDIRISHKLHSLNCTGVQGRAGAMKVSKRSEIGCCICQLGFQYKALRAIAEYFLGQLYPLKWHTIKQREMQKPRKVLLMLKGEANAIWGCNNTIKKLVVQSFNGCLEFHVPYQISLL